MNGEIDLLLSFLDQAFDRPAWHGPNLVASVRGLKAREASWRPAEGRNSIWQIVLHCAFWKHFVRRRLGDAPHDRFPHPGHDWPSLPETLDDKSWRASVRLLKDEHRRLREAVVALSLKELHGVPAGHKRKRIEHVRGIAMHDVYHAGQIRLMRRLLAEAQG